MSKNSSKMALKLSHHLNKPQEFTPSVEQELIHWKKIFAKTNSSLVKQLIQTLEDKKNKCKQ